MEDEPEITTEPLAPFTMLLEAKKPSRRSAGWPSIERQIEHFPELSSEAHLIRRAFTSLIRWQDWRSNKTGSMTSWPFTFHLYENYDPEYHIGPRRLRAITFDDPQALIDRTEDVHENNRGLGPKTTQALAALATAIEATRTLERATNNAGPSA